MNKTNTKRESAEERLRRVYRQRLILGGCVLLLFLYLCGVLWYTFHFQSKTYINGIDVGGKSAGGAVTVFQESSDQFILKVYDLDGSYLKFDGSYLELEVQNKDGFKEVLKRQSALNWFFGGFFKKEYDAEIETEYNGDILNGYMSVISALEEDQMISPTDASLVKAEDGTVSIAPESEGTTIDVEAARAGIQSAVASFQSEVQLSDFQVHPEIYSDNEVLIAKMNQWNQYLSAAGLSFNMPYETVTLDSSAISALLKEAEDEVIISYDLVAALMAEWKDTYDTYSHKFIFRTSKGEDVTIMPWGDYGYQLDEKGTAEALISYIEAGDTGNYDPSWFKKGNGLENNGLGGSYVEVSIEDQHIWVYKNGELVIDTDVVTGNPNPDEKGKNRETYLGCYSIKNKMEDVTLGTLDVQGYESPVEYWVPFNGGEGFHDAPWRSSFGGSIYQTNGSHGCVNCPPELMGTIYDTVEVGDAVVVY